MKPYGIPPIKLIVNRLQAPIVKAVKKIYCWVLSGDLSMLEPCDVKISRSVFRGEGSGKAAAIHFSEAGEGGRIRVRLMEHFSQPLNLKPIQKKDHCFA